MSKHICPSCGHEWAEETTFTRSQIAEMSADEYEQNRDKILKAMSEGKIE